MEITEHIVDRNGKFKHYIFLTDIRKFLNTSNEYAQIIFDNVKEYEIATMRYEMFRNRIPQALFHEWRLSRRTTQAAQKKAHRREKKAIQGVYPRLLLICLNKA